MATDLERLIVSLEARTNAFEKAMKRAEAQTNATAKRIETRFSKLNFGRDAFQPFVRGAVSALLPTLSFAAAVQKTKQALQDFGDIADGAAAAGLDSEFFQSLTYQAKLAGVEIDQSAAALATFAKNSGLAVEGKGRMVTALQALDVGLLENIRNARNQEERIRLVADALNATEDPARRAAIATAAFGDAGLKMVAAFKGGSSSIDETMRKARDLGIVVDRDLIARADELGDEFDTVAQVLDTRLKQALVNLAPVLTWLTGLASEFASELSMAAEAFNPTGSRSTRTIQAEIKQLREHPPQRFGFDLGPILGGVTAGGVDQDAVDKQIRDRVDELTRRGLRRNAPRQANTRPDTPDLPTLAEADTRNKAAAAALKQADAVKELIANLEFEGSLIGKSAVEQAKMNALRQAGAGATEEQRQKIAALVEENAREQAHVQALQDLYAELGDIGKSAVQGIVDAMSDGKIEASELGDILSNVLSMASQFFLNKAFGSIGGGGGGGNLLGSLFGGLKLGFGKAAGGAVMPGTMYPVGERGPELFVPRMAGTVVPNGAGSTGGGITISIDARGATREGVSELKQFITSGGFHAKVREAIRYPGRAN